MYLRLSIIFYTIDVVLGCVCPCTKRRNQGSARGVALQPGHVVLQGGREVGGGRGCQLQNTAGPSAGKRLHTLTCRCNSNRKKVMPKTVQM